MKFSIDHHKMREMILKSIYNIEDRLSKIEQQLRAVEKEIDYKGKESLKIDSLIKKIKIELDEVISSLKDYSKYVNYSIKEYIDMEKRIKSTLDGLCSMTIFHKGDFMINEKRVNNSRPLIGTAKMILIEESCKIPDKEFFTSDEVCSGEIFNGDNILIRSWKSS